MRTTLDLSDDVLMAAREVARLERSSIGAVVSRLARQSLLAGGSAARSRKAPKPPTAQRLARLGIQSLPHRGGIVSNQLIDRIRDEDGV